MAVIHPFAALRPTSATVARVAAVPYDVVNTDEARALAGDDPLSFLRVSRPEIECPPGTPIYSDEVYQRASDNFDRLRRTAPLFPGRSPLRGMSVRRLYQLLAELREPKAGKERA